MRSLHHIALRCADPEATAVFYERAIGVPRTRATEDARGVRAIWLAAESVALMCERREEGEPEVSASDMHLLAFTVAAEEWPEVEARLAACGVVGDGSTAFTLYVRDPDGRRVGLSSYPAPRQP